MSKLSFAEQLRNLHSHEMFKDGDDGVPEHIKDRNGQVALSMCKRCRKAEVELIQPCTHD